MWEPDPAWTPLPSGGGPATDGVWHGVVGGVESIIKRLRRPGLDDPSILEDRAHVGYWRREAEVALSLGGIDGPGLVTPRYLRCEEDEEGITIWSERVVAEPPTSLLTARCLGRFAGEPSDPPSWAARRTLTDRLALAESRGGWPTLQRTTLADIANHLWTSRHRWLEKREAAMAGRIHGDAIPANFVASRGQDIVAVDWQGFGHGPVGTDLGYYALSAREDFDVLFDAFVDGVREGSNAVDVDAIRVAATVMTVYTVFSRAEWALSRVAQGEGALAGKYGHPSVAPHLRALQRQSAQIEALVR